MGGYSNETRESTAVIVGLAHREQSREKLEEYMVELEFLAETAGIKTLKSFSQYLDTPNPKTFIGAGKLNEVIAYVKEHDVEFVIFDDELTPS